MTSIYVVVVKMTSINGLLTCSKELLRVSSTVFLSQSWSLNSIYIKSAFLQSKQINRQVCVKPPQDFVRESMVTKENCLLTMRHKSTRRTAKVKCESFKNDPGLFMYHYKRILHGLQNYWRRPFLKRLHRIFKISSVNKKTWLRS